MPADPQNVKSIQHATHQFWIQTNMRSKASALLILKIRAWNSWQHCVAARTLCECFVLALFQPVIGLQNPLRPRTHLAKFSSHTSLFLLMPSVQFPGNIFATFLTWFLTKLWRNDVCQFLWMSNLSVHGGFTAPQPTPKMTSKWQHWAIYCQLQDLMRASSTGNALTKKKS